MAKRTPAEVYQALIAAGWPPAAAQTMTAISGAESGWRDDALGDVGRQNATWGPSYGLFQIRTIKKDTGSGSVRDLHALTGDIAAQAKAAWSISKHGTDYSPWTTFTDGDYKNFLGQVSSATGTVAGQAVSFTGDLAGAAAGQLVDAFGGSLGGFRTVALQIGGALLGLALIGAGLAAALAPGAGKRVAQVKSLVGG